MSVKAKKSIKTSKQDTLFYAVIYAVILLILIILLWPLIFIVSSSLSSKEAVMAGRVFLLPVNFSLEGYKAVFQKCLSDLEIQCYTLCSELCLMWH
jgi:putative aldouronate transport system permease protein